VRSAHETNPYLLRCQAPGSLQLAGRPPTSDEMRPSRPRRASLERPQWAMDPPSSICVVPQNRIDPDMDQFARTAMGSRLLGWLAQLSRAATMLMRTTISEIQEVEHDIEIGLASKDFALSRSSRYGPHPLSIHNRRGPNAASTTCVGTRTA
jgi:hypothetical protein